MPGITETLDRIAHEADQIKAHAKRSERPTGPITSAVLYLPHPYRPHPSILSLIREATPAERRPFDVYALEELSGASGSTSGQRRDGDGRSYQRLEPHQLTPLRNLPAQKGTPEELKATLHAADEVINMLADGFHPMRRARKQVSDYIAQHDQNTARIAQLQERLDALSASRPEKKAAEEETPTPARSIDEAIAAEEEALRALEASIAPLRRTAAAKAEATRSPPPKASPSRVINSPVSTSKSSAAPTPRKPPVPSPPRFTHTTPKRPVAETPVNNRFTPLHLYTPRTTQRPSSLAPPGSTIVDRVRGSITPAQASAYRNRTLPSSAKPPSDPTPARPTHVLEPEPPTPSDSYISKEDSTPLAKSGPKTVEGVEVDLPYVIAATSTIHKTLGTLLQMCVSGEPVENTPTSTVTHLIKVSRAEPESPASPGTVSSASTAANPAPPVTRDAIVTAHICLILLRHAKTGNDPGVQYPDMLAKLKAIDTARGWNNPDSVIAKWVPKVQGSRTVTRNWAKKGQVSFA